MPQPPRIARPLASAIAVVAVVAPAAAPAESRAAWVWPLRGEVITHYRNGPDPYAAGQHRGIDIAGDAGAPVIAAAGGVVRFAGTAGSSGLTVSVRTSDGRFDISYLHLSTAAVSEGQNVDAGARLGTVGTSGSRSAARPHLHLGVRDAGSRHGYHDPLGFLPPQPTAPGTPRGAPAPVRVPAPLPLVPAPEPVRVPAPPRVPTSPRVPIRPRVPASPRVPLRPPLAAGPRAPVRRRVPARHRAPTPSPARPLRVPAGHRVPPGHRAPADRRAPAREPLPVAGVGRSPSLAPGGAPATQEGTSGQPGPDIGWALACAGLLLAAAVLGLSEDGRKATRRGRDRVSGLLRPLAGRR